MTERPVFALITSKDGIDQWVNIAQIKRFGMNADGVFIELVGDDAPMYGWTRDSYASLRNALKDAE